MSEITIQIRKKIAKQTNDTVYVCGNSGYAVLFDFDEEWGAHAVKTARFIPASAEPIDVVFDGNRCPVPKIFKTNIIKVGVFAGDLCTTTPALVSCKKSILCEDGTPQEPTPDVYGQIMDMLGDVATALDEINGEVI